MPAVAITSTAAWGYPFTRPEVRLPERQLRAVATLVAFSATAVVITRLVHGPSLVVVMPCAASGPGGGPVDVGRDETHVVGRKQGTRGFRRPRPGRTQSGPPATTPRRRAIAIESAARWGDRGC